MSDTVTRFSNRVANYVKYRPDYPRQVARYLIDKQVLTADSIVADVGCGPGISSKMFLENNNPVIGVEPNQAMREAALELLADFTQFSVVNGTAEATTLADHSIDLVVAAQAFHWFDPQKTRAEFERILRQGRSIVLIWNERQLDSTPFLIEYEKFLLKYATDYTRVRHENVDALKLGEFFRGKYFSATFENRQVLDLDGLKGRMFSASYMPSENDANAPALVDELSALFAKHARQDRIELLYDTRIYHSRI
jgi:ubiquinone/menaquinone biosynthesis C-methylase UbiE